MKYVKILLIFVFTNQLYSQDFLNYYELINKAEIAHLDGHFKSADSLYSIAFENKKGLSLKEDFLSAAINISNLNENRKAINYIINGINNGLTIGRIKNVKKRLGDVTKSDDFIVLKKDYKRLRKAYMSSINISLSEEISEMIKKDQKARIPILGSWRQMKKVDIYNYNRLIEIIKENNDKWPGFKTIGEITPKGKYDVTDNIALMLLHFKKDQIEYLKPYMLEAVIEGDMYPYHFARVIDYKEISECQKYGTYKMNKKIESTKICNCENAEKERKKIGFESLDDYYRKINSTYECKE